MAIDRKRPDLRSWVTKPRAFDRGAAKADALIASLAAGNCSAAEFPRVLLMEIRFTKLDSEAAGIVATMAERLADSMTRRNYVIMTAPGEADQRAHVCKNLTLKSEGV